MAIALVNLVAYSTGVTFDLALRAGRGHAFGPGLVFSLGGFWRHPDARVTEDEILRFGVEFADGRRVLDMGGEPVGDDGRPGIVLSPNGGGGGSATEHESGYWLYPLPPSGAVTFAVEWPAKGIPQTARVLDGSLLSEAGARALRQPSTSRSGRSRDRAAIRRHCGGR